MPENYFDQFDTPAASAPPPAAPAAGEPLRFTVRPKGVEEPPASSGQNFFDQFDAPGTARDVITSFGRGVAKGAISLAGLPGDLEQLVGKGVKAAGTALGYPPAPEADAIAAQTGLPTQASLTKRVEDVAGPFGQPQTHLGHDVQSVGEFVPAALAGPGGVVRKLTTLAAIPGVASEEAGRATEGTAIEPYKPYIKAGAAIATGAGASMIGGAPTTANALRKQLPDYVTDAHVGQAEGLIGDAATRGVELTWPEALSQVTGRPVLTDMQRVLESSPRTRATMQEVHGERPQQIAQAAENEFQTVAPVTNAPSTVGPAAGAAADEAVQGVRQTINRAAEPFYQASEGVLLTPQEMVQVRAVPGFQEARNAVRNDPQLNRYVAHLPDNSVGFLNEVKKYLDNAARTETLPAVVRPNMQRAAGYTSDAATVRQSAIGADAARGTMAPGSAYETALGVEQQARQRFLEPLLQGTLGKLADKDITTQKAINALFPDKPLFGSADEVSTAVSALAQRNPWAARQLVRAHLEQKLDEAFNAAGRGQEAAQFAGAGFANRVLGSPVIGTQKMQNVRAAVEALPNGQQIWNGLSRFFEIAQATGTRQPIGSKTAFNEQELRSLSSGSAAANATKTGLSPGKWWSWANDAWTKWQLGQNLDQLARIITDPNSGRLLQRIARMPRNSQGAQLTAARIVAGANASASDTRQPQKQP